MVRKLGHFENGPKAYLAGCRSTVIVGLFLQQIVALFVLKTDAGFSIFNWLITLVRTYLSYSVVGIVFLTDEETANKPWFITHMVSGSCHAIKVYSSPRTRVRQSYSSWLQSNACTTLEYYNG